MKYQVTCINRDGDDPYSSITHLGGPNWHKPVSEVIEGIESYRDSYYVNEGGYEVKVIVAHRLGRKYVKTENDGEGENNLLSLNSCPL